jgi:hypothetical protein
MTKLMYVRILNEEFANMRNKKNRGQTEVLTPGLPPIT